MTTSITPTPLRLTSLLRCMAHCVALILSMVMAWPAWAAAPFIVNANGTVLDSSTSLVWDQCPYGRSGSNCTTGTAFYGTWSGALSAAVAANAANYNGFSDWRVPNRNELESLVKLDTAGVPAIDTAAFPGTPADYFRTSTSSAAYPSNAWIVAFGDGGAGATYKTSGYYVRLVRSGQSLASFDLLGAPPGNVVPTATALAITGTAQFGQVLTGAYVYADADSDAQNVSGAGSSYRFVRSTDASATTTGDNTDVASGTTGGSNKTYMVQAADVGKYLFYCVTPKALTGLSPGVEACSSATAAVAALPQAITGFAPASPIVLGAVPVTLTATGGASGNPVTFAATSAASVCTVSSTTLTYVGVGVCHLTANQAAGNGYSAAPLVMASVTITAPVSAPICSLTAAPARVAPGHASTLTASCSPAAVTYTWTGGNCPAGTGPTCTDAPAVTTLYGVTGSNSFGSSNAATTTVTVKSVDLTPILMLLLD